MRDHNQGRLCQGDALDPIRLRHRANAHRLIHQHATRAGIRTDQPEMQHFARELFLLARQCGAAKLTAESRDLFQLARDASGDTRADGIDFRLYQIAASVLGWSLTGSLACSADRLRK